MSKKVGRARTPLDFTESEAVPFRTPERTAQDRKAARMDRLHNTPFVVWDGEGARAEGKRKPQNYILLGCYNGVAHEWINAPRLTTFQCLDFIIEQGRENPGAIHVGFAFGYDVDMILRSLTARQFRFLRDRGYCKVGDNYRVEHIPGKWFRVTRYGPTFPLVRTDRESVTIYDVWGFFQSSLLTALHTTIADHPLMAQLGLVEKGKEQRDVFTYDQLEFITAYWKIENELVWALINRLREMLFSVGLFITRWHGPGAIASYVYRTNGVAPHKADCGPEIYDAARYAYAGGRFERFRVGRFTNAYSYDINSAYPNAIAKLPSLTEGTWNHVSYPRRIVEFGVYHVRLRGPAIARRPSPLFHRDHAGNITYPWRTEGWYWSPEVMALLEADPADTSIEILEGYEYTGWRTRPFAFVAEMYEQRRVMKAAKNGAQMALKLALNSLYGKMAQRAGWERTGDAPRWHQLEWAGWVTSYTRAMLFRLMNRIPYSQLIAVETDGIYTTATPDELGITDGKALGDWEITHYDQLVYLQSGVYAKHDGVEWSTKYRGLDRDSFGATQAEAAQAISDHARRLLPRTIYWPPLVGTTTRFIGYKHALFREEQNRGPMKVHHCVWETEPKEINCGSVGKRIHSPRICNACKNGNDAFDEAHETVIKSVTHFSQPNELWSHRHDIPWLDTDKSEWRKRADREAS